MMILIPLIWLLCSSIAIYFLYFLLFFDEWTLNAAINNNSSMMWKITLTNSSDDCNIGTSIDIKLNNNYSKQMCIRNFYPLWMQIPNASNLNLMSLPLVNTKHILFHRIAKTGSTMIKSMMKAPNFINVSISHLMDGYETNVFMDNKFGFVQEIVATQNIQSQAYIKRLNDHITYLYKNCFIRFDGTPNIINTTAQFKTQDNCFFVSHLPFIDLNFVIDYDNNYNYNYSYNYSLNESNNSSVNINLTFEEIRLNKIIEILNKYGNNIPKQGSEWITDYYSHLLQNMSNMNVNNNNYPTRKTARIDNLQYIKAIESKIQFIALFRDPMKRALSLFYYLRGLSGGYRAVGPRLYLGHNETHMIVNATILELYGKQNHNGPRYKVYRVLKESKLFSLKQCIVELMKLENKDVIISVQNPNDDDNDDDKHGGMNVDIDIEGKLDVCRLPRNYMTRFYCGQNEKLCDFNNLNIDSLYQAISNLNKYFAFVGVIDHIDVAIYLLQLKFPHLFEWKKYGSSIFDTDPGQVIPQIKKELFKVKSQFAYGKVKHPPFLENSTEYKYLESQNKLDMILFDYINSYYDNCIIPSLYNT